MGRTSQPASTLACPLRGPNGGCGEQGVPPELRPRVWPQVSGAAARQAQHLAGYFEAMVQRGAAESEFTRQIELVPRPPPGARPSAEGLDLSLGAGAAVVDTK